ncbi:hypothetical protein CLTEP_05590 [Clostridium tepidiprofundi DSM 19306]|uniref:DUF1540 domain-containing protein n=1 Tax=Clostridium tepidiprofundi DSM 19306 TaxID=1121338 RepID=A0A151B6F7_9CLOT|nr:DUF1540 domain-containing protein [Clostridium tepidiprofundi]KYH35383.1 hypothetical protein CLTEP_05590 [Clostridium tepidiprofundi DSM 19306]
MNGSLSCSATNCVHNMSGLCSANTINVSGIDANTSSSTQCDTFAEKGLKNSLMNAANVNISGQFRQLFNSSSIEMSPIIRCTAERCKYNENKVCNAANVQITGPGALTSSKTYCETFVKR